MKIKLGQLKKIIKEVYQEETGLEIIGTNPQELKRRNPAAYEALEEPYKNDRSLEFFYDPNGDLYAEHTLHNELYMWTGQRWVMADTGVY